MGRFGTAVGAVNYSTREQFGVALLAAAIGLRQLDRQQPSSDATTLVLKAARDRDLVMEIEPVNVDQQVILDAILELAWGESGPAQIEQLIDKAYAEYTGMGSKAGAL